ncbi:MAG: glucose 1-dehydrogenase [Clostridiales Family XIII bacterium]|nr:glucose 1-dehydrogenase [Clostridiales Family XIII bacterium]
MEAITNLKTPLNLQGKTAIISGGERGIGFGIATAFSQRGARVAVLSPSLESSQKAAAELNADGGDAIALKCDITDVESVKTAVAAAWEAFGHVDILVNNAGISVRKPFLEYDDDISEFTSVINVNLFGTLRMTLANAKRMAEYGGGTIIDISSVGGFTCSLVEGGPMAGYQASKAALNHLIKMQAVEFSKSNIRVVGVAPGPTHTDLDAMLSEEIRNSMADRTCTGRWGEAIEIGAACAFLASDEASQINGVVIPVDGGLLAKN